MNKLDKQYLDLLQDILDNGVEKGDRTGTGTISVFGRQIRHKMSEGYPLLTTKKIGFRTMVTELIWFLRGDTNIKFLVDNGCNIWNGDAYKAYINKTKDFTLDDYKDLGINTYNVVDTIKLYGTITGTISKGEFRPYTKDEFIDKIKSDDNFAQKWGELGPIYGSQWRNWTNVISDNLGTVNYNEPIDQIEKLIGDLKTNPDSRRLMVTAWNPADLPNQVLPPCHYGFQLYTRELAENERRIEANKISNMFNGLWFMDNTREFIQLKMDEYNVPKRAISLSWNQRSVDTPLGLPFNIASYGLLLEIIAKEVNMVPDELIGNLGDTHIYKNQIESIKEQLVREPRELPKLVINTEFWKTESGECGVGKFDTGLRGFDISDFTLYGYDPHSPIKIKLSN